MHFYAEAQPFSRFTEARGNCQPLPEVLQIIPINQLTINIFLGKLTKHIADTTYTPALRHLLRFIPPDGPCCL